MAYFLLMQWFAFVLADKIIHGIFQDHLQNIFLQQWCFYTFSLAYQWIFLFFNTLYIFIITCYTFYCFCSLPISRNAKVHAFRWDGFLKGSKLGENLFSFCIGASKTSPWNHICRNSPQIIIKSKKYD